MRTVEQLIGGAATMIFLGVLILYLGYIDGQWNEMAVGAAITIGSFSGAVYYLTWGDWKNERVGPDEWTIQSFQAYVRTVFDEAKCSALKTSEYLERARGLVGQTARLHGIEQDEVDFIIAALKDIADAEDEAADQE